jgi:hypothetical protein
MREMMLAAYSTRETVEMSIDQVLTAKPLDSVDREQVRRCSAALRHRRALAQ